MKYFNLVNGVKIPSIGMGTGWMNTAYKHPKYLIKRILLELKEKLYGTYSPEHNYTVKYELRKLFRFKKSIAATAEVGYKLFDTANNYNNLGMLNQGLDLAKNKEHFFIISKCSNVAQREGKVREEFEKALAELGTEYIDLFLIHWPQTGEFIKTWTVLEDLYAEGKVKAIGVSNFNIHHIEEIKKNCKVMPMVNEFECHPLLQQHDLRNYCKANGIQVIAHTPTGKMRSNVTQGVIKNIAENHRKSITQVILRWHYQLGDAAIPNSLNIDHAKENLDIFDFELSDTEMEEIKGMDCGNRIWPDPDNCDFTKL